MTSAKTRSERKHEAILAAATELFLAKGYQGTSMDEVAAKAAVSKQTVYKHFADKEKLFAEIILGTLERVADPFAAEIRALAESEEPERELRALAHEYVEAVLQPRVLRLRRLVIGESNRLPQLTKAYYQRAVLGTVRALAECFVRLAERGLLRIEGTEDTEDTQDAEVAAGHFAFLVIGQPLDRAMFAEAPTAAERRRLADAGVGVFLAAYGVSAP